ncbi:hypothetical protein GOP47_0029041 [Adiantum capillus-veneris]|nr:hypothetical protein GOP47_0029041 [Adiantum capillus-veneris]
MATPSASINVMLAVQEKKTNPVELHKPLRQYIIQHYSEQDAAHNDEDLEMVQQMRKEVEKASDSLEARRDSLQRYYRALCMMESRFPISNEKEHVNSLTFTWFDAFKPGKKANQQNIHFEKASIVFNLAAVQSQLALAADRATLNGIKQACNCFQAAAGAFAFLRDNISMKASGNNSTVDISVESAGMLERLMLAQAQECFFEKAISDGKPSLLCGKLARQVSLYYEEALAALVLHPLNQHFDRAWVAHVQLKAAQFHGEACYRIALEFHEKEDIAEEIARLSVASTLLANAKKTAGRGVVQPLLDAVSKLEANVNHNLEQAKKENDRVYLMRVPPATSLAPLPAASLVKPFNLSDVLDASKERMFAGLVPDSSAKALSRYTEMVDDIIRTQSEKLQQESEITRVRLKEMELPESLHALEGSIALPEQLRGDVEAVQIDGGPSGLEAEMRQLQDLRRVNQEMLAQCEEILQKEAREDAQYRAQYGTSWTRPQSSTLTKSLQDRSNNFHAKLKQAAEVDARIERMLQDNWVMLSILSAKPIESALPTLGRPIMSLDGDEDAIVGALKQSLGQLEALGSQRAGLEDMLKEMKRKDNILPKLMTTSGSYEDLFKKELGKYDQVCQEVSKNVEAQEKLLLQIKMQSGAFAAVFNLDDYKASRDRTLSQITAAVAKYREIRDNINNAGIKFYVSLQDAINNLKQQCSDYTMTREIQGRDMIEDLQRRMSNLSFRQGNAASNNQPQRTGGGIFSLFPFAGSHRGAQQQQQSQHQYSQQSAPNSEMPHQPTPQQQNANPTAHQQMPQPPYYSHGQQAHHYPPGPPHGATPPYYPPPPPTSNVNYAQPPYPGWQGPYYNATSLGGSSQPPPAYQAPYYPRPQDGK